MVVARDSRVEVAVDNALLALWTWIRERPAVETRARTLRSRTAAQAVQWWIRRRAMAFQLRCIGGKSPRLFERNEERAVRIHALTMTGRDPG